MKVRFINNNNIFEEILRTIGIQTHTAENIFLIEYSWFCPKISLNATEIYLFANECRILLNKSINLGNIIIIENYCKIFSKAIFSNLFNKKKRFEDKREYW